ncbi:MAG: alpha/beta hydrolase [Clostridia bacterium]
MNRAEFVFTLVDYFMKIPQNCINHKGITIEKNNAYSINGPYCKADYYYKDKLAKKPVLLYIHGGGFVKSDKKYRSSYAKAFADKGYFVYNGNHRLAPLDNYPTPLFDICDMVRKLEALKDEYNLDLTRIVIGGDSSGGYMTAQFLATQFECSLREKLGIPLLDTKISAYLGICSAYNIINMMKSPTAIMGIGRVTGESFFGMRIEKDYSNLDKYKYIDYLSPIYFVNKDWCPCVILYSDKDLFCYKQSEAFIDELEKFGIEYYTCHSKLLIDNHCYQLQLYKGSSKKALKITFDSLDKILDLKNINLSENLKKVI